jgi:hypothetical protein
MKHETRYTIEREDAGGIEMILIIAYVAFAIVGIGVFLYTRDTDEEFYEEPPVENEIGDAYLYRFVESDYERVEKALMNFADELAIGRRLA